jgi:hypothetical protein
MPLPNLRFAGSATLFYRSVVAVAPVSPGCVVIAGFVVAEELQD